MSRQPRAAHFLLSEELADSPPNDALIRAYRRLGLEVDLFAPGAGRFEHSQGDGVRTCSAEYGYRWLARNLLNPAWRRYVVFSGTAENPLAVVGALAAAHRRPSIAMVDEIMSGSYRGDARESWKRLCRWAIRKASIRVVNDSSRVELLRSYVEQSPSSEVLVYPGGFVEPPAPVDRSRQRAAWGVPDSSFLIGFSGGFNLTAGADWLVEAIQARSDLFAVIQPLGVDELSRFLLPRLRGADRFQIAPARLGWREAWAQAAAFDVGVAVYLNPAPQFQNMGTSSNRLCMFLAMGVPVIASRQPSFEFLERYDCGILVSNSDEFRSAAESVRLRLPELRRNALRCWREHVQSKERFAELESRIAAIARTGKGEPRIQTRVQ